MKTSAIYRSPEGKSIKCNVVEYEELKLRSGVSGDGRFSRQVKIEFPNDEHIYTVWADQVEFLIHTAI